MKPKLNDIDQNKLIKKLFTLDNRPSSSTIEILYKLIEYYNLYDICCPSNERLSSELNLSIKTVERALSYLKKYKVVEVKLIRTKLKTVRSITRIDGTKLDSTRITSTKKESSKIYIREAKPVLKATLKNDGPDTDKNDGLNNKLCYTEHNKKEKEKTKDPFSFFFFEYNCNYSSNRIGQNVQNYWRTKMTEKGYTDIAIINQIISKHQEKYRGAPDLNKVCEHYKTLEKEKQNKAKLANAPATDNPTKERNRKLILEAKNTVQKIIHRNKKKIITECDQLEKDQNKTRYPMTRKQIEMIYLEPHVAQIVQELPFNNDKKRVAKITDYLMLQALKTLNGKEAMV